VDSAPTVPPELQQDLHFVRTAVERGEHQEGPAAVYWLWGVITLVGFSMIDLAPQWTGLYWAVMGPLGGVLTWMMLRRVLRRHGVSNRRGMMQEWLAWGGMAVVILLLGFDAARARISGPVMGQLILLIVGYTYYLSYVRRGDRVMLAGGLVMIGGFVLLGFVSTHVWTILGICVFVALAGGSTFAGLTRNKHHA
jgi:hypothetical protein